MDKKITVISFDLMNKKNSNKSTHNIIEKKIYNNSLSKISILLREHEDRLKKIFKNGKGSLKKRREYGVFFSEDPKLNKIENSIVKIIANNKKIFRNALKNDYSFDLLMALQWVKKDGDLIEFLFEKICNGNEEEKNISLLQTIPIVKMINKNKQKQLFFIIERKTLKFPSSCVRNKALSVIMELPKESLIISNELIKFIKKISNTDQINSNYPAKQILKALNIKNN